MTAPFDLTLSFDSRFAAYYTLDGSEPSPDAVGAAPVIDEAGNSWTSETFPYAGPIRIEDPSSKPNGISMIPTSRIPVGYPVPSWYGGDWLPPSGIVPKCVSMKIQLYEGGNPIGAVETRTWVFLPSNISGLPAISISTDSENLFDHHRGILVPGYAFEENEPADAFAGMFGNYSHSGPYFERPVRMEYLPSDGTAGFSADMGVRVGGQARGQPYHTLDFYLRSEYGSSWLHYPILGTSAEKHKRFKLRAGGSVWHYSFFNDPWGQSLLSDSGLDIQGASPASLYINGEFWGVYNVRDSYDERYLMTKYGFPEGIEEDLDFFNNTEYDLGDAEQYNALLAFLGDASAGGTLPLSQENYAIANTMVDTRNFARYQASITALGSQIYPNDHNEKRWRTRETVKSAPEGDTRWRWMVIDCDGAFMYGSGSIWDNNHGLIPYLRNTVFFRQEYLSSLAGYLNTILVPSFIGPFLEGRVAESRPWMVEMNERWGYPDLASFDSSWSSYIGNATNAAASIRADNESRFSVVSAPVTFEREGSGTVSVDWVKVGAESKVLGFIAFPWSGHYFSGVPVPISATPDKKSWFLRWEKTGDILIADPSSSSTTFTPGASGGAIKAIFGSEDQ